MTDMIKSLKQAQKLFNEKNIPKQDRFIYLEGRVFNLYMKKDVYELEQILRSKCEVDI